MAIYDDTRSRYGYHPEYYDEYGLDEETFGNLTPDAQRKLAVVPGGWGQSALSPEAQLVVERARKDELKGDLYQSLALQGAQLAGGVAMEFSPQDRENKRRLEELAQQRATGKHLSPDELELMERQGMGQASRLAEEERKRGEARAASVGVTGVETLRAERRGAEDQAQMVAAEVGANISKANIEAGMRAKKEFEQRTAYESEAMKKRYLEPLAKGTGEMAKLLGMVAGAEPGEEIMGAVNRMDTLVDEDGKRIFSPEEISSHFRRMRNMNDKQRREYLDGVDPRIFGGQDRPTVPTEQGLAAEEAENQAIEEGGEDEDEEGAEEAPEEGAEEGAEEATEGSREVEARGYTYRQDADGKITITGVPEGQEAAIGREYAADSEIGQAITTEITAEHGEFSPAEEEAPEEGEEEEDEDEAEEAGGE